jgi:phage tail sheath protein FI
MAETLLSPGVLARENDLSLSVNAPAPIGAAIIGPTVKGQPNIPTRVTSWSDYLVKFGGSFISGSTSVYTYFTSTAAFNYFQNGGTNLLVTRVVSGSFTPATASNVGNFINPTLSSSFKLQTLSWGDNQNSTSVQDASGSLLSGSSVNLRWEIVSPNTSSGTFNLLVRRGDDNTNNKSVLETWTNISLDPLQDNYIEKVIGNQTFALSSDSTYVEVAGNYPNKSNYITVASVTGATPNYFDNTGIAKTQFTGSIPVAASGTFGSATGNLNSGSADKYYENITDSNMQGLIAANYSSAITLLANADEYQYNVIVAPGLTYGSANGKGQLLNLINNTQNRGDAVAVVDLSLYSSSVSAVTNTATAIDNSYAAAYWPWVQTVDPITGVFAWVPASTMIPAVYAYNDTVAAPWFAPAGLNRGGLSSVVRAEKKLTQTDRDNLYLGRVNPIATFPNQGVVVFGQKTLQLKASALDRVNVRRLLIALKTRISDISKTLVFEQNTIATRNAFLSQVNPYLESVQQQQGLYAFKVVMDDSNNSAEVVDRNQLVGAIYLQPTKTAEYIYLDFNILPTGATFPA